MSASEEEEGVAAVHAAMEEAAVEHELRQVEAQLTGPAQVQLFMTVHDASTPREAVGRTIAHLVNKGFDNFFFAVTDQETGQYWTVLAGEVVPTPEGSGEQS